METLTHEDIEFIKYALNISYFDAFTKLQRKWELGDLEVKYYEHQKQESKRLMEKIERGGVVENFDHELTKEPHTEALNKHNVMPSLPLDEFKYMCSECGAGYDCVTCGCPRCGNEA